MRNYTARNNMKAMQLGDEAFFYHSNIGKEIVGIIKVVALAHPDSTAEPNDKGNIVWECVDVAAGQAAAQAGDARDHQEDARSSPTWSWSSFRACRCPVSEAEWKLICKMGGL